MRQWRGSIAGLLVGVILAGGLVVAGTGGLNVFITEDGRLRPMRPGLDLILDPPPDRNIQLLVSGDGQVLTPEGAVRVGPHSLQHAWDDGVDGSKGRRGTATVLEPDVVVGPTLERRCWEQGGIGYCAWFVIATGAQVTPSFDCPGTDTCTFYGDGLPVFSFKADIAGYTLHSALNYCADAGSTDAYACSLNPALDRYVDGGFYSFKANTVNTGAATLNLNGLGAKTIKKTVNNITTDLADGDICAGKKVLVQYDGINMQMQSPLCNASGGGSNIIFDIGDDGGNDSTAVGEIATTGDTTGIVTEPSADKALFDMTKRWPANPVAPILPSSAIPVTAGMVYGCPIDGDLVMCVTTATLLTADATWRLNFEMPPTLATGCTYKLQLDGKANATSGVLRINPKWNTWAPGVTRTSLTLNAESVTPDSVTGAAGSGDTVTWGAGDSNQLIRVKWTLNASTVTAAQRIAMDLVFEDASTTLAVESGWLASVICE